MFWKQRHELSDCGYYCHVKLRCFQSHIVQFNSYKEEEHFRGVIGGLVNLAITKSHGPCLSMENIKRSGYIKPIFFSTVKL